MNSSGVVPVSIPLKKCSHGTVLQVNFALSDIAIVIYEAKEIILIRNILFVCLIAAQNSLPDTKKKQVCSI